MGVDLELRTPLKATGAFRSASFAVLSSSYGSSSPRKGPGLLGNEGRKLFVLAGD